MYVRRPDLELALRRALAGTKNIIISGESGNGKTWLYKSFFSSNNIHYVTINLSNASLKGGLQEAFQDKIDRPGEETNTQKVRSSDFKAQPSGIGVQTTTAITSTIGRASAFETLLRLIRKGAGNKRAVLVYENFEQVSEKPEIVKAISDTIILLDDDDLSKYRVKICIVGVPTDIQEYLAKSSPNLATLSNRLTEIPEVARMSKDEASTLAANGFKKLGYKVFKEEQAAQYKFYSELCFKTDRIAQHIHEYCLAIAHEAERHYLIIDNDVVAKAEKDWMAQSLMSDYLAIERRMNARETKAGRRNQVLYSLGKCEDEDFNSADIEKLVRHEFPRSTNEIGLNIAGNLSELSSGDKPLIRRTPNGDAYRFTSPKYRMCLRTMLSKNAEERLEKIPLE
jgi:hypothetical protein